MISLNPLFRYNQTGVNMVYLPTVRNVNILYLVVMILVVTVGSIVQAVSPGIGLLITEFILILIPSLLFLNITHYPVRETVRLYWPGTSLAALSVIIGIGFALLAQWLGNLITQLFGYTFPLPPGFYPQNLVDSVVIFSALAIAAPVCEEFMFRGIIQRGYERRGPWTAIIVVGFYFAVYHLSFQRLVAIAPVALVLGYVAWRSNSLVSSMLVHSSYNALSGVLLIINSLRPDINLDIFGSLPLALFGLVLAVAGLWLFNRSAASRPLPSPDQAPPEKSSWLGRSWSLALAFLIFLALASLEFVVGRFPPVLAIGPLQLSPAPWSAPVTWKYELHDVLDHKVGDAECGLKPGGNTYQLSCQVSQKAFKTTQGSSTYQSDAYGSQQAATWDMNSLDLLQATGSQRAAQSQLEWNLQPSHSGLTLAVTQNGQRLQVLALPSNTLLDGEWPWRLQALPFNISYSRKVTVAWPLHYSTEAKGSIPYSQNSLVVVTNSEPVNTPAGNYIAWKVTLGDQSAWYDVKAPHTLLRYDTGVVSYLLTSIQ